MIDTQDFQLRQYTAEELLVLEAEQRQQQMKKMKVDDSSVVSSTSTADSTTRRREVHFQEQESDTIVQYECPPLHEAASLWYARDELKEIHKEIFVSLMEIKNGNLSDFEFCQRGLEEIRKRKPHKRQIRRKEYIANVVALSREQRRALGGEGHPEELKDFAVTQSRSATLRAQHYAALDADEARLVYCETFQPRKPLKGDIASTATTTTRRVPYPSPTTLSANTDSIARSA